MHIATRYDFLNTQDHKPVIHGAGNAEEARLNMQMMGDAGYGLLVCHVHIPEDSKTSVNTAEKRGLILLQELRNEGVGIPCILIALDDKIHQEVQCIKDAEFIEDGTEDMYKNLQALCRSFLLEESSQAVTYRPEKLTQYGKVSIYLKPKGEPSIRMMEGINFDFPSTWDPLQIDMEEITDLIGRSHRIERLKSADEWKEELFWIGKKILKELFVRNRALMKSSTI